MLINSRYEGMETIIAVRDSEYTILQIVNTNRYLILNSTRYDDSRAQLLQKESNVC